MKYRIVILSVVYMGVKLSFSFRKEHRLEGRGRAVYPSAYFISKTIEWF
jgi:hypothetical protein